MTEIEIPDEPQNQEPEEPEEDGGPQSPYRNLFVPLVVVPAMIVMVLVLVFSLFGALAGSEDSPRQNLDDLLNGGANERQQAAFNLVRQILEQQDALAEGREPEWGIDETFLPQLRAARETITRIEDPSDVPTPFVLSSLMARMGDPDGVRQMIDMTRLSDEVDPDGKYRIDAIVILGSVGEGLAPADQAATSKALVELLESPDDGLVLTALAALQKLPGPETVPALQRMLGSARVDQRLQAALSLVALGDASGVDVLREMVHPEPYLAEREERPERWAAPYVNTSRRKALEGLVQLEAVPERAQLEAWADGDPDPEMRELAMQLLKEGTG